MACETEGAPPTEPGEPAQVGEPEPAPNLAERTPERAPVAELAERPSLALGESRTVRVDGERLTESVRLNAEGELVRIQRPEALAMVEVSEGQPCGTTDEHGALQSCQAGTFCGTAAEGSPSVCMAAPRAPSWDH